MEITLHNIEKWICFSLDRVHKLKWNWAAQPSVSFWFNRNFEDLRSFEILSENLNSSSTYKNIEILIKSEILKYNIIF